ncbi:hypothetical protein ACVIHI_008274 [Bradyrhizobium sp. USDA 4524]|nr:MULTISPECIES: hypothetical protein [unclassified Bradyrhizobium]MCP1838804.1 hypothetical protein [Bradyrhizobium sp. USDA 4538]MCP1899371.1 hypothetical protein [Bradyrhizobium sp. USDA 4537]MCP1986518.1 hypothetical protein [Bradyrhizobium sp. USDA 4539]
MSRRQPSRHLELGDVDVAGLSRAGGAANTKHGGIGLVGDRANEHPAKAKNAGLGKRRDDIADPTLRRGKLKDQSRALPAMLKCWLCYFPYQLVALQTDCRENASSFVRHTGDAGAQISIRAGLIGESNCRALGDGTKLA